MRIELRAPVWCFLWSKTIQSKSKKIDWHRNPGKTCSLNFMSIFTYTVIAKIHNCSQSVVYTLISTLFPFSTAIHGSTEPSHMRPLPRVNYSAIELPKISAQCPKYLLLYVYIKLYIKAFISFFFILISPNPQPSKE